MSGLVTALDRRLPRLAFARRVPPGQIAVRLLRRVAARIGLGAVSPIADLQLRPQDELPALPVGPAAKNARRSNMGWHFSFLGRAADMAGAIDWAASSDDRADQLWRMNLHYMEYLPALAPADGIDAIRQWIGANPPTASGASFAAWNAYALSVRVTEWLRFLARGDVVVAAEDLRAIERSLAEQLGSLVAKPETDIGGNHLVRNVRALLWASACTHGRGAVVLRAKGLALLRRVLAGQILADGTHFELSPSYHCQVLGDLIDCRAALGDVPHADLDDAIARMLAAASVMTHRDGLIAQFGDSGLHMAPTYAALARAAGAPEAGRSHGVLPDGGFAAFASPVLSLIMRFGNIAANSLPAHGHADTGSFELSGPAGRIIVDQGVDVYVSGPNRTISRAAASHNLTVAGSGEMAGFFGDFRLGWRPDIRGSAAIGDAGLNATCRHDGFRDRDGGITLTREVRANADAVDVSDSLERESTAPVHSHFLLHPDCEAQEAAGGVAIIGGGLQLRLTGSGSWSIEPARWWPDMGSERTTVRIACRWPDRTLRNTFSLRPAEAPKDSR